jgi:tetratricopeptide (TPR) repeat protein
MDRRWIPAALLICLSIGAPPVLAGNYHELQPGLSTRADADRFFGAPLREIVAGERYDYPPDNDATGRVSVRFERTSGTIVAIDVYPLELHGSERYRDWFDLGEPDRADYDDEGNLVEYYEAKGMELHFPGPDATAGVRFFRHLAPAGAEVQPPIPEGSKAYLGVSVREPRGQGIPVVEVVPGSPADIGGLRKGDLILEYEQVSFYGASQGYGGLLEAIAASPVSRPVRFLVERGNRRIELHTTLILLTDEAKRQQNLRLSRESFEQAAALVERKDFEEAIPHLERAVAFNPADVRAYDLLGYCRLRKKRYEPALAAYRSASHHSQGAPVYDYWIGVCLDRLGNREQAIASYRKFLDAGGGDKKMTRDARRRADYLATAPQREAETAERFIELIDTIRKEMEDE